MEVGKQYSITDTLVVLSSSELAGGVVTGDCGLGTLEVVAGVFRDSKAYARFAPDLNRESL